MALEGEIMYIRCYFFVYFSNIGFFMVNAEFL